MAIFTDGDQSTVGFMPLSIPCNALSGAETLSGNCTTGKPRTGFLPMPNHTKPRRLPVYAELADEPIPEHSPVPYPVQTPLESWFNFWLLSLLAIIAAGSLGWMWGWFRTPSQALTDRNEKLTQQLAAQSAELDRIKTCIDK